jgi:negative regulator of sigma E activity
MGNDDLPSKFISTAAVLEEETIRSAYRSAYRIARDTLRKELPENQACQLAASIARQLKAELAE